MLFFKLSFCHLRKSAPRYGFSPEQGSSFVQLTSMGFPADGVAQAVCTFGTLDEALESLVQQNAAED